MRHLLSVGLSMAGSLVIALCALELVARFIFPSYADDARFLETAFNRLLNSSVVFDPQSANYSPRFGYRLSSMARNTESTPTFTYTSTTNSLGFRSREIEGPRAGEYRVMLLGDSMLWGLGVDDSSTVSVHLETLGAPTLSVYNYSVPGYNTVQEMLVEEAYVAAVNPNHIVLGFFIANDILPNLLVEPGADGVLRTDPQVVAGMKAELRHRLGPLFGSTVFRIIALRVYVPRIRYALASNSLERSCDLIRRCAQIAEGHGCRFSVVVIYPRDATDGGLVERWSGSRAVGRAVASCCRANSIETLDLLDHMNTPAQTREFYFKREGHFTAAGNQAVAQILHQTLLAPRLEARKAS